MEKKDRAQKERGREERHFIIRQDSSAGVSHSLQSKRIICFLWKGSSLASLPAWSLVIAFNLQLECPSQVLGP